MAAVAAEFERQSDAGEVLSRAEQREKDAEARAEAAKILTLRQYGERVFMPSKIVTMSENSRANYQGYPDRTICPALDDIRLPDITPAQISALLWDVQTGGKAHSTVMKVKIMPILSQGIIYLTRAVQHRKESAIMFTFERLVTLWHSFCRTEHHTRSRQQEVQLFNPLCKSCNTISRLVPFLQFA